MQCSAQLNEVTYFRDAFKGRLQQLTRRSREECFTTWNGSSKQIPIIFGGFVRRCVPERLWVKPLLIQQLWPSTLSGRLPGYVVGLVSSLWFLNGTRAPIHDADQRVWSPRPSLKKKKRCKWRQMSVVKQHASGKWFSYGQCFVDALKQCQLFPVTVHQAVGRQMLGYTASVENLCVGREQRISIRAFKTNSRPKKIKKKKTLHTLHTCCCMFNRPNYVLLILVLHGVTS